MQLIIKTWKFHYLIDDVRGKIFKVDLVETGTVKKKKITEKLWVWKGIKTIAEGLEYLSQVEGIPVWKLRKLSTKKA